MKGGHCQMRYNKKKYIYIHYENYLRDLKYYFLRNWIENIWSIIISLIIWGEGGVGNSWKKKNVLKYVDEINCSNSYSCHGSRIFILVTPTIKLQLVNWVTKSRGSVEMMHDRRQTGFIRSPAIFHTCFPFPSRIFEIRDTVLKLRAIE